jgi:DeoR/GlpR family transcriptional regulator of sugar metabolism
VGLRELARAVGASEVTVRRDLRALEEHGLLDRRRGGAAAVATAFDTPAGATVLADRTSPPDEPGPDPQAAEKAAIARMAASLVAAGDSVALGAGTTTQQLAAALVDVAGLTVVTSSLLVGEVLGPSGATVVITGGALRGSTFGLVGRGAEETFADLRVRRAFLSGDGVTSTWGLSTDSSDQAGVDRRIADSATEVLVLADHTKLGRDSAFQTVPPGRIDHLVTDELADPDVLARLAAAGVTVHVARTT